MNRSYLLGTLVVVATILVSAGLCLALVGDRPKDFAVSSAGESLDRQPLPLGTFRLTERSGRSVTQADLADRVWVAAFIFTRCPASCPRISAQMKGLQEKLGGTGVRLVSISVDPEHDTPDVLAAYARGFQADPDRWWFLTGPSDTVYQLVLNQFRVPVTPASEEERARGAEAVAHSQKLALVDRGNRIVGYFDANDPDAIRRLQARARKLDNLWATRLPTINAALNGTCGFLLLTGWLLIRRGQTRAHIVAMSAAVVVSGLFLTCYLVYHFLVVKGSVPFQGIGRGLRTTYFTILLSHTVLAAGVLPLIVLTLIHAVRGRYDRHLRIARVTFPIWLYVSITGVVVYWMLYRMDFSGVTSAL